MNDLGQYRALSSGLYYIPTDPVLKFEDILPPINCGDEYVTVVSNGLLDRTRLEDSIRSHLGRFLQHDDVFSDDFLNRIYIHEPCTTLADTSRNQLTPIVFRDRVIPLSFLASKETDGLLPSGPYFKQRTGFHEAWKVFKDTQDAFVMAVVPLNDAENSYRPLQFPSTGALKCVAAPSRCYTLSRLKPLSGLRFAVKDNIHVRGCTTAAGSSDFGTLYGPQIETATVVTELLQLGAILLGKTKTAQFGDGDTLTADWVETPCPWNPRGDGYLIPSGSSAGSAAAVAAYGWLDFTVGTDTLGSIRGPALWQGIYGIRPTWSSISCRGVVPVSEALDCVGLLARSLNGCLDLTTHYLASPQTAPTTKFKLLFLDEHWTSEHQDIKACQEQFVATMEQVTQTSRVHTTVEELWRSHNSSQECSDFHNFSDTVARDVKLGPQYKFLQNYIEDFQSKHMRRPYLNPVIRAVHQMASYIAQDSNSIMETEEKRNTLSAWVNGHVFDPGNDAVVVLAIVPMTDGRLTYRDEYHSEPIGITQEGWHPKLLSSLGGIPEVVVPIGEHRYVSHVTTEDAYLPVTASVLAPKKHETIALMVIKEALELMDLPSSVRTGQRCYGDP